MLMIARREYGDPRCSRIMLRKELVAEGIHDAAIARLVADGTFHRLRHGAYVLGDAWRSCDEVGQHGLLARAVIKQTRTAVVLSHLSALGEWDVPLWDTALDDVHITRLDQKPGRRREAGVQQHLGALRVQDVVDLNGLRVTAATRSAMDSLSVYDVEHGVTTISDLLHRKLTSPAELEECRRFMQHWPDTLNHRLVLALSDGRFESVGEARTFYLCWRQGVPRPEPQFVVEDGRGLEVARVDCAWPELKVFLEFDGKTKYVKFLKPGESVTDVVLREKHREELVCEVTGWRCIRLVWADLYRPERTAARIRALFSGPTRIAT